MHPNDLIVIALLPKPSALEHAQAGWYRIPLQRTPPYLGRVRALAFYQPASFGDARWQVRWWGRVERLETLPRRALLPAAPAHPRADALYTCVRLAPLQEREPLLRATKGRRLLFVPLRWAAFQAAATLDALFRAPTHPITDDPRYQIMQQQLADKQQLPPPDQPYQKRLLEPPHVPHPDARA